MKISVVTAAYNSAVTIADTLRSVNAQSHPDIEHLIIDGGSTDETVAIARELGERVVRIVSEKDRGIYDAMNKGLALATGDVIGLLNSDDLYPDPGVLAAVAAEFAGDPGLDAIWGDLCYVAQGDTGKVVRYWRSSEYQPGLFHRGWVPPHPTFFVRREVYQRFGNFDLRYRLAADWELLVRFIEVHRIRTRHCPRVMVHMRLGGATNQSWSNVWKQNEEIVRAARAHGLRPSLVGFVLGKLWSRSRQFLSRAPVDRPDRPVRRGC